MRLKKIYESKSFRNFQKILRFRLAALKKSKKSNWAKNLKKGKNPVSKQKPKIIRPDYQQYSALSNQNLKCVIL